MLRLCYLGGPVADARELRPVIALGAFVLGAFVAGAFVAGAFVAGAFVVGAFVVGAFGFGRSLDRESALIFR
ncbi:MAG TPA: hypothetical protein VK679_16145, partial [Gemmatimonadaceae bacterium]|nr:hypothetical protein [Gemmatimonadaceae bacterium]